MHIASLPTHGLPPPARSLTILVLEVHGRARGQQHPHFLDVPRFCGFQQVRAACVRGCHPLSTIMRSRALQYITIPGDTNHTLAQARASGIFCET
eukprot:1187093-Prorocentrum_minimum.AAC.1